jgi:hypothetical protein
MYFKITSGEDHIFNNDENNVVLENYNGWKYTGPVDYYNTGTMRIIEHYPNLDLYKIKANWGQGCLTLYQRRFKMGRSVRASFQIVTGI